MPLLTALWDPEDVLEIGQVSPGITCVGEAKTMGRRCHHHLARASYQQASKIILQMSSMMVSNTGVDGALASLARLLLCKYSQHQEQAEEVAEKWRSRIRQFEAVAAQLEDNIQHEQETLDQAVRQNGPIALAHHESEATRREIEIARLNTETFRQDASIARQAHEAALRVADIARQEAQNARRDAAIARQEIQAARRDAVIARQETQSARLEIQAARRDAAIARQEAHTLRLEAARNIEAVNAWADHFEALSAAARPGFSSQSRALEASTRHPDRPSSNYIDRETAQASSAATSCGDRKQTTIPSSSNRHSVPTEESNGRLASVTECSICLHRFGDEGIVRCVARCQQPFHGECIDAWLEERTVCPLW